MKESLISEAIEPILDDVADLPIQTGEPVLPKRFRWRRATYRIESVLETWKQYSGGSQSMPEHYLRKHWFHVTARKEVVRNDPAAAFSPEGATEMKIYFERQARSKASARWWIYTVVEPGR